MSHTNELDNGVAIIANGGDLSGDVTFILPDGRRMETTWDRMFALEVENVAMRGAISVALQVLGIRPHPAHIDVLQAAKSIRETVAALSPPTGKVDKTHERFVEMIDDLPTTGKVLVDLEKLREIEWASYLGDEEGLVIVPACPKCMNAQTTGHSNICWLGNLLKDSP